MTSKEKAVELVDKMYATQGPEYGITYYEAIDCALIAVKEIIQISDINKIVYSFYEDNCLIQYTEDFYWEKVKKEIERL